MDKKAAAAREQAYQRSLKVHGIIRLIVCILITVISLFPIYIIVINATRSHEAVATQGVAFLPGGDLINNFNSLLTNEYVAELFDPLKGYLNSLIIAGGSTLLAVFFSGLTAYGLTVYDFKLKGAATIFVLAVMMIPTQVISVGFMNFMAQIGLLNNMIPLILPSIASPAVVFFMLQYMKSSFPLEIVEAARIDGCGEFRTFLQIGLPMLKPAFAVQAIFAFVASWNNYYTPSMLFVSPDAPKTMPMMVTAVVNSYNFNEFGAKYLAITLSVLPVIIVYLALSKFIVKGVALGAVKG
ncbi:MAG: carbohydrate ABC transporter permease [Oscillospiraceae bacterium]|nr:carbohydrate ABC transporter permease [Oscillospiraceae bacterium]